MMTEELVLRKVKFNLRTVVGVDVLRSMRISEVRDVVADEIVYEIRAYFLGKDVKTEVVDRRWIADGWWDSFKVRYFPDWLLSRFPDRGKMIDLTVTHTHVCPHLDLVTQEEERRAHLGFLAAIPDFEDGS